MSTWGASGAPSERAWHVDRRFDLDLDLVELKEVRMGQGAQDARQCLLACRHSQFFQVDLGHGKAVGVDDDADDDEQSQFDGAIHWLHHRAVRWLSALSAPRPPILGEASQAQHCG